MKEEEGGSNKKGEIQTTRTMKERKKRRWRDGLERWVFQEKEEGTEEETEEEIFRRRRNGRGNMRIGEIRR